MPIALVNSLEASESMVMPASVAPVASPHAFITKGSLTLMQMISSTPLAAKSSLVRMKLGTWAEWQVGVNAPGTAKSATLRPFSFSPSATGSGPLSPICTSVASGSLAPLEIVIMSLTLSLRLPVTTI